MVDVFHRSSSDLPRGTLKAADAAGPATACGRGWSARARGGPPTLHHRARPRSLTCWKRFEGRACQGGRARRRTPERGLGRQRAATLSLWPSAPWPLPRRLCDPLTLLVRARGTLANRLIKAVHRRPGRFVRRCGAGRRRPPAAWTKRSNYCETWFRETTTSPRNDATGAGAAAHSASHTLYPRRAWNPALGGPGAQAA